MGVPHNSDVSRFAVVELGWVVVRRIEEALVVLLLVVTLQSEHLDHRLPAAHPLHVVCDRTASNGVKGQLTRNDRHTARARGRREESAPASGMTGKGLTTIFFKTSGRSLPKGGSIRPLQQPKGSEF
jgi:hypothetical protein